MKELLKSIVRPAYYAAKKYQIYSLVRKSRINDARQIPIIINNKNRVTFLKQLIAALEDRGYTNIYIIDNNSTYAPLLNYYKTCKYQVFRLKHNVGHLALWKTGIYKKFSRDFFVYTDSDVVPVSECPDNFLQVFLDELKRNRDVYKIGLSLKIDDLPDHFINKTKVIAWESQFHQEEAGNMYYDALVDTTFALYKPGMVGGPNIFLRAYRSKFPFTARHMPWYVDSEAPDDEERYYTEHAKTITHWTSISS